MTFKPAHKDTDTPPGQIVNEIPRSKTIGGIVDRVMRSEALPIKKKLSCEEWMNTTLMPGQEDVDKEYQTTWAESDVADIIPLFWKAAQENV